MTKALALFLLLSLAIAAPASAQEGPNPDQRVLPPETEKALREGAERIKRALEDMLRSVPQYELPEITEQGDIVIRRKRTEQPPRETPEPGDGRRT